MEIDKVYNRYWWLPLSGLECSYRPVILTNNWEHKVKEQLGKPFTFINKVRSNSKILLHLLFTLTIYDEHFQLIFEYARNLIFKIKFDQKQESFHNTHTHTHTHTQEMLCGTAQLEGKTSHIT